MQTIIWVAIAFFCGALPFSVWVGKLAVRTDIRQYGDHNPGATNVLRAGGKGWALLALILDIFKGALPVALAWYWAGLGGWSLVLVALAPILGHAFSPFLGFKGGKALAVSLGVWGGLTAGVAAIVLAFLMVLWYFVVTKDAWAVMLAAFTFLAYLLITDAGLTLLAIWVGNTLIIAFKHRSDLNTPPVPRHWLTKWIHQ